MARTAYSVKNISSSTLRALNYSPILEKIIQKGSQDVSFLGDMVDAMGPAYGSVFVRYDCNPGQGVELLSQSDMFALEPQGRWIRPEAMPKLDEQVIKPLQILIAGAGTLGETELYGRSIIADSRLEGKIVGPHSMTLTFNEPGSDESLFAYAFLCTKFGIEAVRSTSFGTKVLSLRRDLLKRLPIPKPTANILKQVADLVRVSIHERERFWEEVKSARQVVESMDTMQVALEMCRYRRRKCVSWKGSLPTFTAWTYSSAGDALKYLQSNWSARLTDVVEADGIFKGNRSARQSCSVPYGVDFMSQRDVFLVRPIPQRIIPPKIDDSLLYCPRNTLLVGGQGTLGEGEIFGRVALMGAEYDKIAFTEHILRMIIKSNYYELAYAFFSSIVGFRLIRTTAVGTKLLSLRPDLLRELPFPTDEKVNGRASLHVLAALDAKFKAVTAENESMRIIEEEVLPAWLS